MSDRPAEALPTQMYARTMARLIVPVSYLEIYLWPHLSQNSTKAYALPVHTTTDLGMCRIERSECFHSN